MRRALASWSEADLAGRRHTGVRGPKWSRRLKACAASVLVAWSLPASAQAPLPARVTLEEALARAAAQSHRLAELRARESAAGSVVEQRKAAGLPIVSAQAGYQRTNHVDEFGFIQNGRLQVLYPDVPDNWRGRLDMQWPIYTGGRTAALERAAIAERNASDKDLASARADLRLETTRAFWALVTATESVTVVQQSVKRIEAQLADVRARFDAGFLPPNDVLTVEARVSSQRTLLIQAENQRDSARADLARLMGAAVDAAFEVDAALGDAGLTGRPDVAPGPPGSRPVEPGPGPASLRADREALSLRADAAEQRIEAAKADRKPSIAVVGGVDYARPNPRIFPRKDAWEDSWDVGVNVSWTLWNGGRTDAQVAEARHQAAAARERVAEFDRQIALEVRQRQLDLESARAQVGTAADAVRSATEARRVVAERFTAGVATTTDLLDAQVDQLQAELDRTRALANVKLAEARLERAKGN
jgi:outer membrane protein TolC